MLIRLVVVAFALTPTPRALAAPFPIGLEAFSAAATRITYGGTPPVSPVDGQTWDGVLHEYFVDGEHAEPAIFTSLSIPGFSGQVVQGDVWHAVLSLTLPDDVNRFAFDFLLNMEATFPDAVSVRLFDSAGADLGALSFGAAILPGFSGNATKGFAGIGNGVAFRRIELRFDELLPTSPQVPVAQGRVFAIDNLRFEAAVPEPSAALLLLCVSGVLLTRCCDPGRSRRVRAARA